MNRLFQDRKGPLPGRSEEFRILFENVPAYIVVVDRNYRILKANRNFVNTFGDQVGEPCFQAYKGLREKCPTCPVEHTFLEGTLQVSEEMGRSRDGREVYYLVYSAPIHDRRRKVKYALEMSIDLTERKNLEKALHASQDFLNNLIENSFCGIMALDVQGRVIIFNRSAERIFGYGASEVIGTKDWQRFFPKNFSPKILSFLGGRSGKETLPADPQETCLRSKTGERLPLRFSALALSREGSTMGAVGFFEDLRPMKALEREKLQAEKLAAVGQTVAGFAHGIKNIVTGLEGGLYVVRSAMKRKDDHLLQKGWKMVEKNIEKVSHLMKDLLNYSRSRVPDLKWVNPHALADEVCSLFQERASQQGIQLCLEVDRGTGTACLDPKGIHTCLTNLLSNALDACLSDPAKTPHWIRVRTRQGPNKEVFFEVEDNGPGMPQEIREKLFTPFFSTKGVCGTGLGLLVTQKIVQEHGGSLTVETEPGRGSMFRLVLPQGDYPPRGEKF
jgi:histidine kinase